MGNLVPKSRYILNYTSEEAHNLLKKCCSSRISTQCIIPSRILSEEDFPYIWYLAPTAIKSLVFRGLLDKNLDIFCNTLELNTIVSLDIELEQCDKISQIKIITQLSVSLMKTTSLWSCSLYLIQNENLDKSSIDNLKREIEIIFVRSLYLNPRENFQLRVNLCCEKQYCDFGCNCVYKDGYDHYGCDQKYYANFFDFLEDEIINATLVDLLLLYLE